MDEHVEATLDRVLDGYPLIYYLATQGRTQSRPRKESEEVVCTLEIKPSEIFQVTHSETGHILDCWWLGRNFFFRDTITGENGVVKNAYLANFSYGDLDNENTDSVTLVGNNKVWPPIPFSVNEGEAHELV